MKIEEIDLKDWQQVVDTLMKDNFFQQPNWLNLVSSEFGLINHYLKITINDSMLFLSIQIKNDLGYSNFIGYGGPATSTSLTIGLLTHLIAGIEDQYKIIIVRMKLFPVDVITSPLQKNWKTEHASVLKIYPEWEQKIKKQTLYSIKYAIKNGVEVKQINKKDLVRFYEIYQENMDRVKSSYKTPESLFNQLFEFSNVNFIGAFINGNLEAVDVFLNQGERSSYWWGTSTLVGRKYNANYLILFLTIKELQKTGIKVLDMASSNNQGISNFKAQWNAELKPFLLYQSDY
jgi:hypothetical protein